MASPITEPVGKPGTQWRGCSGHPQPSALRQGLEHTRPGRETLARVEVASRKGRCCWGFPSPILLFFCF
uniref:Uncharacterized protein n=1 Tax=Cercocebus atys TaxID=9531 RepID=A0A2K5LUL6_CERAT